MTKFEIENKRRAARSAKIKEISYTIEKDIEDAIKDAFSDQDKPSSEDAENFIFDEFKFNCELNELLKSYGKQKEFYQSYADVEMDRVTKKMIQKYFN